LNAVRSRATAGLELGVNFAIAAMIIGTSKIGWRFLRELLEDAAT
jgi:hypothetical protein